MIGALKLLQQELIDCLFDTIADVVLLRFVANEVIWEAEQNFDHGVELRELRCDQILEHDDNSLCILGGAWAILVDDNSLELRDDTSN